MTDKTEWEAKLERVKLAAYRSGVEFGEAERDALREALREVLPLAEGYLMIVPDKRGNYVRSLAKARQALAISEKSE